MKDLKELKLVIFDMDGTLCNTEDIHAKGWKDALTAFGYEVEDEVIQSMRGKSIADNNLTITEFTKDPEITQKIRQEREAYILHMIQTDQVKLMPGVQELLSHLKAINIPMALATTSYSERAEKIINQLGIADYFDTKVFGDMITHQKPNPEIYLKVLEMTQVPVEQTIAVEDSPSGLKAARSAGIETYLINDWIEFESNQDRQITHYQTMYQLMEHFN